jgi:hypothetical protein
MRHSGLFESLARTQVSIDTPATEALTRILGDADQPWW